MVRRNSLVSVVWCVIFSYWSWAFLDLPISVLSRLLRLDPLDPPRIIAACFYLCILLSF